MSRLLEHLRLGKRVPEVIQLPPKPAAGPIVPADPERARILAVECQTILSEERISQPKLEAFTQDIIKIVGGNRVVYDDEGGYFVWEYSNDIPEGDENGNIFGLSLYRTHNIEAWKRINYVRINLEPEILGLEDFNQRTSPVFREQIDCDPRVPAHPLLTRFPEFPENYVDQGPWSATLGESIPIKEIMETGISP